MQLTVTDGQPPLLYLAGEPALLATEAILVLFGPVKVAAVVLGRL